MKTSSITRTALAVVVVLGLCGYTFEGQVVYAEDSNDTYIVVDDMEVYNDRDDIREVWKDGYPDDWVPYTFPMPPGSNGSNLNVSTAVGSPFNGATGPIYGGDQAMVLRYDNDGFTYSGLPGIEKWLYPVSYYSEIQAYTVGDNSLDVGRDWAATGCTELSLWFQGHPISDGDYDATEWPLYTVSGRGRDIGGRHDEFYFLSQYPFVSKGAIQVKVTDMDDTDPWAKAGVMIREKWTPYSKFAAVFMTPGQGISFQYRDVEDGPTTTITKPGVTAPQYVKLERTDSGLFIAYHSDTGYILWQDVNAPGQAPVYPTIDMGTVDDPNIYIGTAVTSHNALETCTANFGPVEVFATPVPATWVFGNIGTNAPERLYVALEDTVGNVGVVKHNDVEAATAVTWQEWKIPLTAFTGVDFSSVEKVYIGLGDRDNPVAGGSGAVYIDEIYLTGIPVGETYHVDGVNGNDNNDGLTPGTAFATIQKGIDTAVDGDNVIVYPDRYTENINFLGKNIIVTSTHPDDPACVALTVIQGTGTGPVVTFSGSEGQSCILDGLTITGGNTMGDGGGICGNGTEATIANCVITNNHADGVGGGVSNCSGRIVGCTITGNTAGGDGLDGGGGIYAFDCNVTIEDCDINNNTAADNGGGLCFYDSPGSRITRCTISDNDAIGSGADGGGIFVLGVPLILIEDCRIIRNSASAGGGGVYLVGHPFSDVIQVRQCLITENTAGKEGGGISCKYSVETRISNCTIADNQVTGAAGVGYGGGLNCSNGSNVEVINSIIWGNFAEQGFQVAVRFEMLGPSTLALSHSDVEGGQGGAYVEAGSTLDWGIGAIDSDPQLVDPNGGDWHLGAGSPCIDAGDNSVVTVNTDLDGNSRIVNGTVDMGAYEYQGPFKRYYYVDAVNGDDTNNGLSPETAFATIQKGIDTAEDNDVVVVYPGLYSEIVKFLGKNITLRSTNPIDPNIVRNTIIDGYVEFSGTENPNCSLAGFNIHNLYVGAIYGRTPFLEPDLDGHTHATISYCILGGNGPCEATVIKDCDGAIKNCVITDNSTVGLCGLFPVVYGCHGLIKNCTIANNSSGVGVYDGGTTTIEDCIIYSNVDPQIRIGIGSKLTISYSDVQGGLEGISGDINNVSWGAGNIDKDPCFVRLGEWIDLNVIVGDYHLLSERGRHWPAHDVWVLDDVTSPCVDAGDPAVNPASERQPNGGRINMGAYGGTAYASMSKWAIAGDINHDGVVNMLDIAIIAQSWLEHVNQWPKVHITQPPDGCEFCWLTDSVQIEADAWDVDGSVVKVEFFVNGGKIGEDNDGTDGWVYVTSFNIGTYVLTAKATDDKGAITTSPPVTITAVECP